MHKIGINKNYKLCAICLLTFCGEVWYNFSDPPRVWRCIGEKKRACRLFLENHYKDFLVVITLLVTKEASLFVGAKTIHFVGIQYVYPVLKSKTTIFHFSISFFLGGRRFRLFHGFCLWRTLAPPLPFLIVLYHKRFYLSTLFFKKNKKVGRCLPHLPPLDEPAVLLDLASHLALAHRLVVPEAPVPILKAISPTFHFFYFSFRFFLVL